MILSAEDRRARACAELRRGVPIVIVDNDQAVIALSAEMLTADMLEAVRALDIGPFTLTVSDRRAQTLRARVYDGDLARVRLPDNASAHLIRAIADPAMDLDQPLSGPHLSEREGRVVAHREALLLCKRAKLLPAALIAPCPPSVKPQEFAHANDLTLVRDTGASSPEHVRWREASSARVPLAIAPNARLRVFRREGWDDEHYAIEIGSPSRSTPVLTRLHSACATGDLFGSLKCDCGPQLHAALHMIAEAGGGVLLYLLQEGRGIGLANKMRAYKLQDDGFDTVEANHRLGFDDDERLLTDGGEILREMGFKQARLLTNNPKKLDALTEAGIDVVERVPLITEATPENEQYLRVKAVKSGHLLPT